MRVQEKFMPMQHTNATHRIRIAAPIAPCHRFFTPAGEELWVDGWQPRYLHPQTGQTRQGMVFTTGSGDDYTIWHLVDFDTTHYYSRYVRVTPALRSGMVEVRCSPVNEATTDVDVSYTLTALSELGKDSLRAFEGAAFVEMIEGWKQSVDQHLPALLNAYIR